MTSRIKANEIDALTAGSALTVNATPTFIKPASFSDTLAVAANLTVTQNIIASANVGIGTSPEGLLSFKADESNTPKIRFQNQHSVTTDAAVSTFDDANGTTILIGSNLYIASDGTTNRFNTSEQSAGFRADRGGLLQFYAGEDGATATERIRVTADGKVGIGTTSPSASYTVTVNGGLAADFKSFIIDHPDPAKPDKQLAYASSETPEHNVFVRGKAQSKIIELPDHWPYLVHEDSISVQLTPIGEHQELYVESIKDNKILINNSKENKINCFYLVHAERKDIGKLETEPNKV